jgi:ATP-binding cassette, subfamily B, bacterial MsbA
LKEFFKKFAPYILVYKKEFTIALIAMVVVAISTSATAYIIKPILDDVFINKDQEMLYIVPLGLIIIYTLKSVGRFVQAYYMAYIGQNVIRQTRDNLLKSMLHLDLAFFQEQKSGELISRITNDINRIQTAVSHGIAVFFKESLTIVALIGVIIYQSPKLAFISLVVLPLAIYPLRILAKKMKRVSHSSQSKISDLTAHLSEIFNNIEIIKAYNAKQREMDTFSQHNLEYANLTIKQVKTNELVSPVLEVIGAFAVAGVIIVGGTEVMNETMTVGSFFSFLTALFMLYTPIKVVSSIHNFMQDAVAASERIFALIDKKPEIIDGETPLTHIDQIEIKNLILHYGEKVALNGVSLEASRGETIALIGKSGSGKSSLINLLLRFYDYQEGDIILNNEQKLHESKTYDLREKIALVSQRIFIFNDTVLANVTYGHEVDKERAIQALKDANAYEFVEELTNGIDTLLDEFGSNLSGGQRQRISIARALYKNPDVLIFDEATSALDNKSERLIQETLEKVSKDKITFVIAHRLSTIKNATKIILMEEGKILCQGDNSYLLEHCEEYRKLQV